MELLRRPLLSAFVFRLFRLSRDNLVFSCSEDLNKPIGRVLNDVVKFAVSSF